MWKKYLLHRLITKAQVSLHIHAEGSGELAYLSSLAGAVAVRSHNAANEKMLQRARELAPQDGWAGAFEELSNTYC